jgi:hypothetical protein
MPKLSKVPDEKIFLVKGKTLNALIRAQNQVEGLRIAPAEAGTVTPSDLNLLLDLSPLVKRVEDVELVTGFRQIPFSITAAGDVPTSAEIETGIEAGYSALSLTPRRMDFLYSTPFHYVVGGEKDAGGTNVSENGIFRIKFDVGGVNFMAHNIGPNRLYS